MDNNVAMDWNEAKELHFNAAFPIHCACRDGNSNYLYDLCKQNLITKNQLSLEDEYYGWTSGHWAAFFGKLECLHLLLESVPCKDFNLSNIKSSKFAQTCAHLAAFGSNPQCLMLLLQAGSDPNSQDYIDDTPLHKAARIGSLECVTLLIKYNANVRSVNNQGQSAAILARDNKHKNVAEYLFNLQNKDMAENPNVNASSNGYYGFHLTHATSSNEGMDMDSSNTAIVSNGFGGQGRSINQNVFSQSNGQSNGFCNQNGSSGPNIFAQSNGQSNGFGNQNNLNVNNIFAQSNSQNIFAQSNVQNVFAKSNGQSNGFGNQNGHSNVFGTQYSNGNGFGHANGHSNIFGSMNGESTPQQFGDFKGFNQPSGTPMNLFQSKDVTFGNGPLINISVGGRKRSMEEVSLAPEGKRLRMKEPALDTLTLPYIETNVDANKSLPAAEIEMDTTSVSSINKNQVDSQPQSRPCGGSGFAGNPIPMCNNHIYPSGFRTYCTKNLRSHYL